MHFIAFKSLLNHPFDFYSSRIYIELEIMLDLEVYLGQFIFVKIL